MWFSVPGRGGGRTFWLAVFMQVQDIEDRTHRPAAVFYFFFIFEGLLSAADPAV